MHAVTVLPPIIFLPSEEKSNPAHSLELVTLVAPYTNISFSPLPSKSSDLCENLMVQRVLDLTYEHNQQLLDHKAYRLTSLVEG